MRRAYREQARQHHPDRVEATGSTGSADEMAAINEAWRVLGDPGRRAVYDRSLAGPVTSAAPSGARAEGSARPGPGTTWQRPPDAAPARIPWRFMAVMATLGIMLVLAGVVFFEPAQDRPPDGIIRPGSCVAIEPNRDAREVACTGQGDLVVERLVPMDGRCPVGTTPHRDRLGLGIACVLPPERS